MLLDGAGFLEDALIPGWRMLRDVDEPIRLVGELRQPDPAFLAASAPPTVVLKKGPNLSANAAASTAFDQAAAIVESLFDDPVTIVVDAEIADLEEGILGQTDAVEFSLDYDDLRSRIVDDADPATEAIVSRLPTSSQLNLTFPESSFSFSGLLRMTRANLLAVGVASADLSDGADSQYDPTVKRDMSITFNSRYTFDYTRSDGISSGTYDFVAVAVHEMLHGLGFVSTVDMVDLLLDDSSYSRSVEPTSLDLFRLLPGQGSAGFTMASRVLAPGSLVPQQVVYDGGVHDFRAAGYAGISVGDIPVATGKSHGDGRQGSHFKDNGAFSSKLNVGIMDPVLFSAGVQIEVQSPDVRMLGLIGWDVAELPQTTLFQTDFTGGLPDGWTISEDPAAADGKTWTTANPADRENPLSGTFVTVDSQWAGSVDMDESLISPSVDLTDFRNTTLQFTHYFRSSSTEKADVEVRVNGGSWQNLARYQTRDASGNVSLDVSAIADAQPDVQFRWRYWDANHKLYWQLDNIRLSADPFSWPVKKNAKFAVVDNLVDDLFGYASDGKSVSRGYLAAGATDPRGVATTADGLKTWILNYDKVVYVHDGDGDVLGSWTASQLKAPTGIATSGSDLWIVDKGTDTVYRFAGAVDATSGELTATSSFKLNAGNATPEGLATDGTQLWVVDGDKPDRVYVYDTAGGSLGSWSIDPRNTSPTGIAIDPAGASQNIWIVDISKARVYEYVDAGSRTSGSLSAETSFALASANASPHDIAVLGLNAALQLNAIGPQSIAAGMELSFSISAVDEGLPAAPLTYAASDLPPGATFDPATHTFRWTPVMSQAPGTYAVTFSVTDGVAFAAEEVVISVFDPYPWQNHVNPPDADGDGHVSPLDALVIVNRINLFGSGLLPPRQPEDPYFDVNRDGRVGPDDTLVVINCLNAEPEAEGESVFSEAGGEFLPDDFGQIQPVPTAETDLGLTSGSEIEPGSPSFDWLTNRTGWEVSEATEFLPAFSARSRPRLDWQAAADRLLSEPDWFQGLDRWM